jgi:hypothetical protein
VAKGLESDAVISFLFLSRKQISGGPTIPLPSIYQKDLKSMCGREICIPIGIAALVTKVK